MPGNVSGVDYSRSCFVDIPYDRKTVAGTEIDFESVYDDLIAPAIRRAGLHPFRTKDVYDPRPVHKQMFLHILQSMVVVADITGDNPNVMLELGARIATDKGGTVLVGQHRERLIYDIVVFQVVKYNVAPPNLMELSIDRISAAVKKAHAVALANEPLFGFRREIAERTGTADHPGPLEGPLNRTFDSLSRGEWEGAARGLDDMAKVLPDNALVHQLRGLTLRAEGRLAESSLAFQEVVKLAPQYADGQRELGVTAARKYELSHDKADEALAHSALGAAKRLSGGDARTLTYLGGLLEKEDRLQEAMEHYRGALGEYDSNDPLRRRVEQLQLQLHAEEPEPAPQTSIRITPAYDAGELKWKFQLDDVDHEVNQQQIEDLLSSENILELRTAKSRPKEAHGVLAFQKGQDFDKLINKLGDASLGGRRVRLLTPSLAGALSSSGEGGGSLF